MTYTFDYDPQPPPFRPEDVSVVLTNYTYDTSAIGPIGEVADLPVIVQADDAQIAAGHGQDEQAERARPGGGTRP